MLHIHIKASFNWYVVTYVTLCGLENKIEFKEAGEMCYTDDSTHIENAIEENEHYPKENRCPKCEEMLPLAALDWYDL